MRICKPWMMRGLVPTTKRNTSPLKHVAMAKVLRDMLQPSCAPDKHASLLQEGLRHVVRFVEWFQEPGRDLWLVFRDEGVSLHALMYNHVALGSEHDAGEYRR